MSRLPPADKQLLAKIVSYLGGRLECSMGEIEEELGIKTWKQQAIYRFYRDSFPGLELKRGRWKYGYQGVAVVPETSQEILFGKGE